MKTIEKTPMILLAIFASALLFGFGVLACMAFYENDRTKPQAAELFTVTTAYSPDHTYEALVTDRPGGATVPFIYRVYMARSGAVPSNFDLVLWVDHSERPTVKWLGDRLLLITCSVARVRDFKNYWYDHPSFTSEVSVSLACGERGYNGGPD